MMDNYALPLSTQQRLFNIFKAYDGINKVILYGSRAKGTHHERSDIDLVIANSRIDRHELGKINQAIKESDIPYLVDIELLEKIKNPALREHIERVGRSIYQKDTTSIHNY